MGPHCPLCAAPPWLAAVLLGCLAPGPGQLPLATAQLRVAIEPTNVIRLGSNNEEIKVRVWIDGQQEDLRGRVELATFFSDGEDGVFDVDLNSGRLTPKKEGTGWVAVAYGSQRAMVQVDVLPQTPPWDRYSAARCLRTTWPELRPQRASFISLEQFLGDLFNSNDPNDLRVDFLKKVCDLRPGRVALGGYQLDPNGFPKDFPVALKLSDNLADPNNPNAPTIIKVKFNLAFEESNGKRVSPNRSEVLDSLTVAALDRFIPNALKDVNDAFRTRRLRTRVVEGLLAAKGLTELPQIKPEEHNWVGQLKEQGTKLEPLKTPIEQRDKLLSNAQGGPNSGFLDYPETLTLDGHEMVLIIAPPGQDSNHWHVFYIDLKETEADNIEAAREALKNRADRSHLRLPTRKEWIAAARHLQAMAGNTDAEQKEWPQKYREFIFGRKEWCEENGRAFAMGGVTMKLSGKDHDVPPLDDNSNWEEWLGNPLVNQLRDSGDKVTCMRAVLPITGATRLDAAQ